MLHHSWKTILFFSFVSVLLCNALIACFASSYYKNTPIGRLNPSQLRVKQGNATVEQRLNVFVLSFLFGITSMRNLFLTIILAAALNFIYLALA
jgi:hypothetical protein